MVGAVAAMVWLIRRTLLIGAEALELRSIRLRSASSLRIRSVAVCRLAVGRRTVQAKVVAGLRPRLVGRAVDRGDLRAEHRLRGSAGACPRVFGVSITVSPQPASASGGDRQRGAARGPDAEELIPLPSTSLSAAVSQALRLSDRRARSAGSATSPCGSRAPRRAPGRARPRSAREPASCASWSAPARSRRAPPPRPAPRSPCSSSTSACWSRGAAAPGCTFCAVRAASSAAFEVAVAGVGFALAQQGRRGERDRDRDDRRRRPRPPSPTRTGTPSDGRLVLLRSAAPAVTSTEASRSRATGSTGICHIQSTAAVRQNATQPARAAASERSAGGPPAAHRGRRRRRSSAQEGDQEDEARRFPARRGSAGIGSGCRAPTPRCRRCAPTRVRRCRSRCRSAAWWRSRRGRRPRTGSDSGRRRCRGARSPSLGLPPA